MTMTQTAKTYGSALYELAVEEKLSGEILEELNVLCPAMQENPEFIRLLSTPSISKEERCQVLDSSFRGKLQPYLLNFLKILCERGYMRDLQGCYQEYRSRYNADNGILEATAITAVPLSDGLRQRLHDKLAAITGKTVDLTMRVDPACIGGIRLELDGTELDGTVRHRLDDMKRVLSNTVL